MQYRVRGLSPDIFTPLFGLSDKDLAARGARRCVADARPGFPYRIELRDATPGQSLILVNYEHQPANTPYRASHAIFVREGAGRAFDAVNEIPEVLRTRPISLRAFDAAHMMLDAELLDGQRLAEVIERLFGNEAVAYLHAHYAKRGCYAARIERA